MTAEIKGKTQVVTIDLHEPRASRSGKTLVVASSHGNKETTAEIKGQPVVVGLNAYIRLS